MGPRVGGGGGGCVGGGVGGGGGLNKIEGIAFFFG